MSIRQASRKMQKLFILGHPVAHSKSPAMHNAAYAALGLDWEYGFADCPTPDEAQVFLDHADWMALNITMPYKPLAASKATWRSAESRLSGGANVLVRRGSDVLADNTDGKGCIAYLLHRGVVFQDARVVVCGTGPTSLALMHAAIKAGAAQVALLGRDEARAADALAGYRAQVEEGGEALACAVAARTYAQSEDFGALAQVILDATPLGMKPDDPAPFDTSLLSVNQVVFDVVYGHGMTKLLSDARAAGCTAFNGEGMLVGQAVETVRDIVNWLDISVDVESIDLFSIMAKAAGFSTV